MPLHLLIVLSLPTNGVLKDGNTEIQTVNTDLSGTTLTYTQTLILMVVIVLVYC